VFDLGWDKFINDCEKLEKDEIIKKLKKLKGMDGKEMLTKGPWKIDATGSFFSIVSTVEKEPMPNGPEKYVPLVVAEVFKQADANMIEVVPEMYALIRQWMDVNEKGLYPRHKTYLLTCARKILDRAEGKDRS